MMMNDNLDILVLQRCFFEEYFGSDMLSSPISPMDSAVSFTAHTRLRQMARNTKSPATAQEQSQGVHQGLKPMTLESLALFCNLLS